MTKLFFLLQVALRRQQASDIKKGYKINTETSHRNHTDRNSGKHSDNFANNLPVNPKIKIKASRGASSFFKSSTAGKF